MVAARTRTQHGIWVMNYNSHSQQGSLGQGGGPAEREGTDYPGGVGVERRKEMFGERRRTGATRKKRVLFYIKDNEPEENGRYLCLVFVAAFGWNEVYLLFKESKYIILS